MEKKTHEEERKEEIKKMKVFERPSFDLIYGARCSVLDARA